MNEINSEIGKKIRNFRKGKGMTINQLGALIFKSKATISKYENGEISIDIVTLYNIANALNINVEQLLYIKSSYERPINNNIPATFFKNTDRYYAYYFDGRNKKLVRCVIDIMKVADNTRYRTMLYMNVDDFEKYQYCENIYVGYTEHYDVLTTMILKNQATPIENININILASFLESDKKWGLMSGVSFRPFMPIALKMLISKKALVENKELMNELKISKEDIRLMKIFNMLTVT